MADSVEYIYDFVNFIAAKTQSGAITDDDFNTSLQAANWDFFKQKTGLPEQFQAGFPYSAQQWQVSQIITEALKPFFTAPVKITKNASGYFPYPTDYLRYSSIQIDYSENPELCKDKPELTERFIEVVTDGEWVIRLDNSVIRPSLKYPIANFYSAGIRVNPYEITAIKMAYLRKPAIPFRNYTVNASDQTIYNPVGSVQVEWDETFWNDIAAIILGYYGITIRDGDLYNYAQQRKAAGV